METIFTDKVSLKILASQMRDSKDKEKVLNFMEKAGLPNPVIDTLCEASTEELKIWVKTLNKELGDRCEAAIEIMLAH